MGLPSSPMCSYEPDPATYALELYARGLAGTREAAARLVDQDPAGVRLMLASARHGELQNPADIAHPQEWGTGDTGQGQAA